MDVDVDAMRSVIEWVIERDGDKNDKCHFWVEENKLGVRFKMRKLTGPTDSSTQTDFDISNSSSNSSQPYRRQTGGRVKQIK